MASRTVRELSAFRNNGAPTTTTRAFAGVENVEVILTVVAHGTCVTKAEATVLALTVAFVAGRHH